LFLYYCFFLFVFFCSWDNKIRMHQSSHLLIKKNMHRLRRQKIMLKQET
jgi:hypothetical protein